MTSRIAIIAACAGLLFGGNLLLVSISSPASAGNLPRQGFSTTHDAFPKAFPKALPKFGTGSRHTARFGTSHANLPRQRFPTSNVHGNSGKGSIADQASAGTLTSYRANKGFPKNRASISDQAAAGNLSSF
jgi:hypothetical protein